MNTRKTILEGLELHKFQECFKNQRKCLPKREAWRKCITDERFDKVNTNPALTEAANRKISDLLDDLLEERFVPPLTPDIKSRGALKTKTNIITKKILQDPGASPAARLAAANRRKEVVQQMKKISSAHEHKIDVNSRRRIIAGGLMPNK
jgi:hypothetical protein